MLKITKIIFVLMTFSILLILWDCKKQDTFSSDGYYSGSFSYQGQILFKAINFNGSNYAEAPSGGALNQKFPFITKGTYKIKHNIISFTPDMLPDCSCSVMLTGVKFDCLLNGDYTLVEKGNKITFQRGTGTGLQIYNLTLVESNP